MSTRTLNPAVAGVSSYVLALRQALRETQAKPIASFSLGALNVEVRAIADSVWALVRR